MRPRRTFGAALAVLLALVATGAAWARSDPDRQAATRGGATIVQVDDGFDWADAGIGAAGGFALSVLGAGVVLLVRSHPSR